MPPQISLDPGADTLIRVVQRRPDDSKEADSEKADSEEVVDFKVLAAALSTSPYWESFIRHMNDASGLKLNTEHIEDTGITIVAVEIVLRGLHQSYREIESTKTTASSTEGGVKSPEKSGGHSPLEPSNVEVYFPPKLKKADIDDVWGVLALINLNFDGKEYKGKFIVNSEVVAKWFHWWRKANFATFNTQADFEKVLFPTFAFHDEKGFCHATKWLCQRTSVGNIQEYSPLVPIKGPNGTYISICLNMSFVRIARSKLRTDISNKIWSIVRGEGGWLSDAKCNCWVVAHYNYLNALKKAGVLCPELDRRETIMELVQSMKEVKYEEPLNPCLKCSTANITMHLQSAIKVAKSFRGLPFPRHDGN